MKSLVLVLLLSLAKMTMAACSNNLDLQTMSTVEILKEVKNASYKVKGICALEKVAGVLSTPIMFGLDVIPGVSVLGEKYLIQRDEPVKETGFEKTKRFLGGILGPLLDYFVHPVGYAPNFASAFPLAKKNAEMHFTSSITLCKEEKKRLACMIDELKSRDESSGVSSGVAKDDSSRSQTKTPAFLDISKYHTFPKTSVQ